MIRLRMVIAVAVVLGLSTQAAAETTPEEQAAARALFDEARGLVKEGHYDQACPKFEESQRLGPGIGTMYNLADCYEHVGRTASAWVSFLDAASKAKLAGQTEREQVARQRAQALEPRLIRLQIVVPSELAGLEIRRDGTVLGKAMWGQSLPVDPGQHDVTATAPDRKSWSKKLEVNEEGKTITISVPALALVAKESLSTVPKEDTEDRGKTQRIAGLVTGGVGIVSLGVAGVFALQTRSKVSDAEAYCNGASCTDRRGVDLYDDAGGTADLATVFSLVGVVGVGTGAVLYLTAPSSATKSREQQPSGTAIVAGPGTVHLVGAF